MKTAHAVTTSACASQPRFRMAPVGCVKENPTTYYYLHAGAVSKSGFQTRAFHHAEGGATGGGLGFGANDDVLI